MKKRAALASAFAVLAATSLAKAEDTMLYSNADKSFTLSGGIGLANIDAREFVYEDDYTVSRLDWQTRGLVLFTLNGEAELPADFRLKASISTGTGGDHNMEDRDWIYPANAGPNGPYDWTDRSLHPDTSLEHYWTGNIELDKTVYATEDTALNLGAGFKYTDVKWAATGGSFIYSNFDFHDDVGNFADGTKVISYRQQIPVFYASAGLTHDIDKLTLGAGIKGGFTFGIRDTDDHFLNYVRFHENMYAAPMIGLDASATYRWNENTSLYLAGGFERVFHARGDMDQISTINGSTFSRDDSAGADFRSMQVSFGLKMSF